MISQYYVHQSGREQFLRELHEGNGSVTNFEAKIRREDGQIICVSTHAHYFRDEYGNVTGVEGTIRDITRIKQQEQQLLLTQLVSDQAPDSILWINEQAGICYANESSCRELGYSRNELLSMSIPDIDPDYTAEIWPIHWQELKQSGQLTFETRQRNKAGVIIPFEVSANFVKFGDSEYNVAFCRNISTRKKNQDRLRKGEERLRVWHSTLPIRPGLISISAAET